MHSVAYGKAACRLIEPDEIRILPERQTLVLADVAALLLAGVKPYYSISNLA